MSVTVDCGEGKCHLCIGWGRHHYLFPQLNDGEKFTCDCPCHKPKEPESQEEADVVR